MTETPVALTPSQDAVEKTAPTAVVAVPDAPGGR